MISQIVLVNKKWSDCFVAKNNSFCNDDDYTDILQKNIENNLRFNCSVLEAGGIDRPLWHKDEELIYDGLDIEYKECCKVIYDHFIVQSIEEPIENKYDLIVSKTLFEHVPNNRKAFHSIYQALSKNGKIISYQPSKYHPYSLLLRLIGNRGQRFLIKKLLPWLDDGTRGYPAYFNYCSPWQMRKLLTEIGFKSVKITCFYHANSYFSFCFPLFLLITLWENICKKLNWETCCAGFIVEADK